MEDPRVVGAAERWYGGAQARMWRILRDRPVGHPP